MANYTCAIRTNYFKVKDEYAFEKFMKTIEDQVSLFIKEDACKLYAFGKYNEIYGLLNDNGEYDEYSYQRFLNELHKHVADDDAILIFESGNELLRYVIGTVTVITSKKIKCIDIHKVGLKIAKRLLNNPCYDTDCYY